MEPMTMPAMAPPERPLSVLVAAAAAPVEEGVEVAPEADDEVGKSGGRDVTEDGIAKPVQRLPTCDAEQQESVALGELAAQYVQRPFRFVE